MATRQARGGAGKAEAASGKPARAGPPPPPAPPGAAPNETADRILHAALEVFAEHGFDGATTREIAAKADVNLGLLQYYFGDKDALWKAAIGRVYGEMGEELASAAQAHASEPDGGAAAVLRTMVRFAARRPSFIRLMNDEGKRSSVRMRWLVDHHGRGFYEAACAMLESFPRRDGLRGIPAANLYFMLIGAVGMIFSQAPECRRLTGTDPTASQAAIEQHADAVVRLFLDP
jgi:TetR/AcrR family transcriptional regulator